MFGDLFEERFLGDNFYFLVSFFVYELVLVSCILLFSRMNDNFGIIVVFEDLVCDFEVFKDN